MDVLSVSHLAFGLALGLLFDKLVQGFPRDDRLRGVLGKELADQLLLLLLLGVSLHASNPRRYVATGVAALSQGLLTNAIQFC